MDIDQTVNQNVQQTVNAASQVSWGYVIGIIIGALLIRAVGAYVITELVKRSLKNHRYTSVKERQQRHDTLVATFMTVMTATLIVVALILILVEFGVNFAALLASAGALAVVGGIAGQSILKDLTKGVSIILYNQMRIGDIVTVVDTFSGVVEHFSLRFTRLRDLDGNVHIVPNGEITVITNHSLGYANVNLDLSVSYDSDIDHVIKVINQVGQSMGGEAEWKDIIKTPVEFLRVDSFGDSAVNIKALGEVQPGEQWAVAGEFRKRLKEAFDREGIEIPYPQRVIHQMPPKAIKTRKD